MTTRPVLPVTTATTGLDTSILASFNLDGVTPVPTGLSQQSTKVAGFAKAINLFYKILVTDKGSNPLSFTEGTGFGALSQSNITDIDTLYVDVKSYVTDAFDQVVAIQTANFVAADEKLTAVDIVTFKTVIPSAGEPQTGTTLSVGLSFYNAAGGQSPLQLPSIVLT